MTSPDFIPSEVTQAAAVVNVAPSASEKQITNAFRLAARAQHPDLTGTERGSDLAELGRARDTLLQWSKNPGSFAPSAAAMLAQRVQASGPDSFDDGLREESFRVQEEPADVFRSLFRLLAFFAVLFVLAIGVVLLIAAFFTDGDVPPAGSTPAVAEAECVVVDSDGQLQEANCASFGALMLVSSPSGNAACPADLLRLQGLNNTFCLRRVG